DRREPGDRTRLQSGGGAACGQSRQGGRRTREHVTDQLGGRRAPAPIRALKAVYLGCALRSRERGRPRPQASAAARKAIATASSRRRAIASSVRWRTVTLFRIVHPERPETVGGSRASPGARTDQVRGGADEAVVRPREEYGRLAESSAVGRSTSKNALS